MSEKKGFMFNEPPPSIEDMLKPDAHKPVEVGRAPFFDESAPVIEDVIADLAKDVPEEELDNIVSDPEQERHDLIAIRDAVIELIKRIGRGEFAGCHPRAFDEVKGAIDAQHYPKAG